MTFPSSQDLTAMRGVLALSLPDTAVIHARSYVSDGGGGGTLGYTAAGTVSARVAPLTGSEGVTAGRLSPDARWVVTLPAGTSVTEDSRIVISGTTYEVEAVRGPRSFELSRRVEVSEVS